MGQDSGEAIGSMEAGIRDEQLETLADAQRRRLLLYLLDEEPASVTLSAAVAHLARTSSRDYQQVQTVLLHRHLPKLVDAGVVAYSPHEELLTYIGDKFVTEVLELL